MLSGLFKSLFPSRDAEQLVRVRLDAWDAWLHPAISQAELLEAIHPQLVAHFQPALLARFQTLAYRPLDAGALASIVRLKLAKIADRLRRQHDVALTADDALTDSLAQRCLARESGARNVDAFLNQRILPAVSRELLTRMANGEAPAEIQLSGSSEGNLTIDFVEHDDVPAAGANAPAVEQTGERVPADAGI